MTQNNSYTRESVPTFKREVFDGSIEYVSIDYFLPAWENVVNHPTFTGKSYPGQSHSVNLMYRNAMLLLSAGF